VKFQLVTIATTWAITLAEAKLHLLNQNITTNDDNYVTELIKAAQRKVEEEADLRLSTETYKMFLDDFPSGDIELWVYPINSITHVKYYDADGNQQTVSSDDYKTDLVGRPARIVAYDGFSWPDVKSSYPNSVEVQFITGYPSPAVVPEDLVQAMFLLIADWYVNREDKGRRFNRVSQMIINKYKYI